MGEFLPPGTEVASSTISRTDLKPDLDTPEPAEETVVDDADRQAQFDLIKAALDQLQLIYEVTASQNFKLIFDIADGRIRAIYVVRNPDKLRGFLEHTH